MGAFSFLMACIVLMIGVAIVTVKGGSQARRDADRKTYQLFFPNELEGESVVAWIRSISGTLRRSSFALSGVPTIGLEMIATNYGIRHRLQVPWQYEEYVIPQLRARGVRVDPEDEYHHYDWRKAVELRLTHSSRTLQIVDPGETSLNLLSSVQSLGEGEVVMMQWVITPAVPRTLPVYKEATTHRVSPKTLWNGNLANRDEVNDRREKLSEPNMLAVLRLAAIANTDVRAEHLLHRVRDALASTRGPLSRFERRLVTKKQLRQRLSLASGALNFPIQLAASELAALIAWPIGNPHVSGLPPYMARHLPASEAVSREGRIIGRSNFPGSPRKVAMAYSSDGVLRHVHVAAPTGSGKSVLLANMAKQDMENKFGLIVLESKGDLFHRVLDYVPPDRINDVIVLDVMDGRYPLGFNILQQGNPHVVIDELVALFNYLYRDTRSVWTSEALYHGLRTLAIDPRSTFVDLPALLTPTGDQRDWAHNLRRSATDPELRQFWQRMENEGQRDMDRFARPLLDRIWQLTARPKLRYIIGQSESSFQMADVIRNNKILLINLQSLEADTASLAGTLIMNAIWHAVKTTSVTKPNFLYLDEFQSFINLPVSADDMLAKARGFGLGMVLAHQNFAQLPPDIKSAVLNNARSKIYFQTTSDDARVMAREFKGVLDDHDFMSLRQYEGAAVLATNEGVSPPLTFAADKPAKGYYTAKRVVELSRQKYGREQSTVSAEIEQRYRPTESPRKKKPLIGGIWDDTER